MKKCYRKENPLVSKFVRHVRHVKMYVKPCIKNTRYIEKVVKMVRFQNAYIEKKFVRKCKNVKKKKQTNKNKHNLLENDKDFKIITSRIIFDRKMARFYKNLT